MEESNNTEQNTKSSNNMAIPLSIIGAGLIIAGAIIFNGMGNGVKSPTPSVPNTDTEAEDVVTVAPRKLAKDDHIFGNANAPVIIVEYSDTECPFCKQFHPTMVQLLEEFPNDVRWVYRHFPLPQHGRAPLAAQASEAAAVQGKFWEMHDLIFESQHLWSSQANVRDIFVSYAEALELDVAQFESDLDAKGTIDKVRDNYTSGVRSGVNSTPSFFLNGQKLRNPSNYEEFKGLIEAVIVEVGGGSINIDEQSTSTEGQSTSTTEDHS